MKKRKKPSEDLGRSIRARGVPLSPEDQALFETGKEILAESHKISRDFCKYMISVSTGAIPLYLGLLGLTLPKDQVVSGWQALFIFVTAIFFVVAAVVFVIGYFPQARRFSIHSIEAIRAARTTTMKIRYRLAWIGFSIFLVGVISAIVSVIWHL